MSISAFVILMAAASPAVAANAPVAQAKAPLRCEMINVGTFFADARYKRVCGTKADWAQYRRLMQKRSREATSGER